MLNAQGRFFGQVRGGLKLFLAHLSLGAIMEFVGKLHQRNYRCGAISTVAPADHLVHQEHGSTIRAHPSNARRRISGSSAIINAYRRSNALHRRWTLANEKEARWPPQTTIEPVLWDRGRRLATQEKCLLDTLRHQSIYRLPTRAIPSHGSVGDAFF